MGYTYKLTIHINTSKKTRKPYAKVEMIEKYLLRLFPILFCFCDCHKAFVFLVDAMGCVSLYSY